MLKKIVKMLINQKSPYRHSHYSSSDYKKRHYGHHHAKYGHLHYKKKKHRGSFFSSFFSS